MEARDREVGRRISALRAGLHAAAERFEELLLMAQEQAPEMAGEIEEARADIDIALDREDRMREQDHERSPHAVAH